MCIWSCYNLPMLMRIIFHPSSSFPQTKHHNPLTIPLIFPWKIFWAPFRSSIRPDGSFFIICLNCMQPSKLFRRYILQTFQVWLSVFLKTDSIQRVRLRRMPIPKHLLADFFRPVRVTLEYACEFPWCVVWRTLRYHCLLHASSHSFTYFILRTLFHLVSLSKHVVDVFGLLQASVFFKSYSAIIFFKNSWSITEFLKDIKCSTHPGKTKEYIGRNIFNFKCTNRINFENATSFWNNF